MKVGAMRQSRLLAAARELQKKQRSACDGIFHGPVGEEDSALSADCAARSRRREASSCPALRREEIQRLAGREQRASIVCSWAPN